MINAISAADIAFIMVSSTSAWLLSPLECLYYLPQPSALADNTDFGCDNSWYHAQPHPIIVYYNCYITVIIGVI